MDPIQQLTKQFSAYVPNTQVAQMFAHWVVKYRIKVKITQKRKSKRGDYRPPHAQNGHRISINGDLNPYAFSVTFIHEIAHLYTWEQFKHTVAPHGPEWKSYFKQLMNPFLKSGIFPKEIHMPLEKYMDNPAAATCRDDQLMDALAQYNKPLPTGFVLLKEVAVGQLFQLEDGRVFRNEGVLRKNFRCKEMLSGKYYRISPQMEVRINPSSA